MKKIILLFSLALASICYGGPPDAESINLRPSGFIEVSDALIDQVFKDSISLVSAFIPRELRPQYKEAMEPVGWFDKEKNICQIRCGGVFPKALFQKCIKKGKWQSITTPTHYLTALHAPADAVTCFDGELDGCPTHVVWIEVGESFMIVSEIRQPSKK